MDKLQISKRVCSTVMLNIPLINFKIEGECIALIIQDLARFAAWFMTALWDDDGHVNMPEF